MAGKVSSDPNIFLLPDLGEGLEEAELIEWCVKEGQHVDEFDVLAKMETDKALSDVPSPRGGTIARLHGKAGDKIKVGSPLVTFQGGGSNHKDAPAKPSRATAAALDRAMEQGAAPRAEQRQRVEEQKRQEEREDAGTVVGSVQNAPSMEAGPGKVIATPAVRRLARDMGVDLSEVTGTGIGGRITERDLKSHAQGSGAPAREIATEVDDEPVPSARPPMRKSASAPAVEANRQPAPAAEMPGDSTRIPFRGIRRTIAERLRQSVNFAVHFNVMDDADVSKLDELRRRLAAASGEKVTFLPFVAAAVSRVLSGRAGPQFVKLNATVDDDAGEILQHRGVHLGIATDTDNGLMVPVIRDADKLGVLEIQRRINALARAARDRSIPRDQLTGGTFTVSNVGSLAGRYATPIINYPEAGILAVGRARDGVVVRNGMLGVGKLLPLSLACDHRVVDGSTAATALAKIIELLQAPEELMPVR
jgi:pyruvate dehydrogenase E2 component (dihydrolipoamide acetyltransferase)